MRLAASLDFWNSPPPLAYDLTNQATSVADLMQSDHGFRPG